MDANLILYLGRYTLETALLLSAPVLIVCTLVGLIISILQAVTSIRDMTLTVVPKLIAVGFTILLFGSWMLEITLKFTIDIFSHISKVGHF
ncbi:MAG: flagellar biosynthetic protein FliQ [Planctomycetes bacterium GWF2_50_10]|nr:MAG: flagellar biosynthetic protein FliQ [Planctomycetes bacterium GWF2_50_10]